MKLNYEIKCKHLELNVVVQTTNVNTHSVLSSDQKLQEIVKQGVDFLAGLIKHYDNLNYDELEKVGK